MAVETVQCVRWMAVRQFNVSDGWLWRRFSVSDGWLWDSSMCQMDGCGDGSVCQMDGCGDSSVCQMDGCRDGLSVAMACTLDFIYKIRRLYVDTEWANNYYYLNICLQHLICIIYWLVRILVHSQCKPYPTSIQCRRYYRQKWCTLRRRRNLARRPIMSTQGWLIPPLLRLAIFVCRKSRFKIDFKFS